MAKFIYLNWWNSSSGRGYSVTCETDRLRDNYKLCEILGIPGYAAVIFRVSVNILSKNTFSFIFLRNAMASNYYGFGGTQGWRNGQYERSRRDDTSRNNYASRKESESLETGEEMETDEYEHINTNEAGLHVLTKVGID